MKVDSYAISILEKKAEIRKRTIFQKEKKYTGSIPSANYHVSLAETNQGVLYKYMTIDSFIQCIEKGNIRFNEPSGWNDRFEQRFYNADYKAVSTTKMPKIYATCLTETKDCEAPWKTYSKEGKGLGRCVQIPPFYDERYGEYYHDQPHFL